MTMTNMTARQFLNQVYRLDERINSKLEQLGQLKTMATHITSNITDMKVQTSHSTSRMEDTVLKIIEQEQEIDREIDALVDLKADIRHRIDGISNIDHRLILEKRYLLFEDWSQIAVEMSLSVQHVFRLHTEALKEFDHILKVESK